MKIAFNPSTVAALTTPPNNKDITFDLRGRNIFAQGVKFYGTDTNTWRDIKINNVSIGSHTLDLRNGSNTTLTNTNGVVTINSTWRPVVDNLTSDSTTSSLSAKQGKVLKALIGGNSSSATKLQTARKLWGQSFDGTADVSGTLSGVANIQFSADGAYDIGSNAAASRYIYTHWLGAKSGSKLELGANNSGQGKGLCIDTNLNVGIGTTSPTQKLDVHGNISVTGQITRKGSSQIWIYGREVALLRETSISGYHTLWSLKTTNGSWDFGEYHINNDWNNVPVLSYISDSDYNSGKNAVTYQIKFPLASGTVALTSNMPNPTNYYWANVKISTSSSTTTSPTFSDVYLGNSLHLNNRGRNAIYNGPIDSANGVGGPLNNLVFSSWQGVSFTTSCEGMTYTNKNAVSINCRTGQLYAREVQANGFRHTGHNNNDAVLLAGGGYKTLKDFIFLNKSYNYTDNDHYNLAFHKLSGICNNLVWVDGHVKGSIKKNFVIDPAFFPYRYNNDSDLNTIYLMSGNNYITINAAGVVTINNVTDRKQRVGFFYTGRA